MNLVNLDSAEGLVILPLHLVGRDIFSLRKTMLMCQT